MARKNNQKITEDLITIAEAALCRRFHKGDVKRLVRNHVESRGETIGNWSLEAVISRAKERLVGRTQRAREDHRADAYTFYDSVLRDKTASVKEKLIAQERIDKLLGLETPAKLEIAGPAGNRVEVDVTREVLENERLTQIAELFERELAGISRRDGLPPHAAPVDMGESPRDPQQKGHGRN